MGDTYTVVFHKRGNAQAIEATHKFQRLEQVDECWQIALHLVYLGVNYWKQARVRYGTTLGVMNGV